MRLPTTPVLSPLITQFVKSSTSIGANYCEADDAESKADFRHKIALCRKESRETKYWCRLLAKAAPQERLERKQLWLEARELHLIFCKIIRSTDSGLHAVRAPAPHRPSSYPARN
ncbi:MAG: four helix bundle protein [Opitutaceae bacterium]|nr:four helix bundle protein [Opitutaceae bacterium]